MSAAGWLYTTIIVLIVMGGIATMVINDQAVYLEQVKLCQQAGGRWVPFVDNFRIGQPNVPEHCEYIQRAH